MIEIKLLPREKTIEACEKQGVEAVEGMLVYAACERGDYLGSCGFEINGTNGRIVFTSMNGEGLSMLEDGLLRSSLAYMYDRDVENVSCDDAVNPILLKRLGFRENNGVKSLELKTSFLSGGSCCVN